MRQLAKTINGSSCIALCAALSDLSPNVEAAAIILNGLVEIHDAPQALRPSLQQWSALVKSCSGLLVATRFGCVTRHFMHLDRNAWQQVGESRDVAEALNTVGKLSRGSLTSISLVGNATCGWLAAFGHYFFGLEVEIRQTNGDVLLRILTESTAVHITVIYGEAGPSKLQVANITYVIRNASDLLSTHHPPFQVRIAWHGALQTIFEFAGKRLLKAKQSFGQLLGSAARMFEAVSKADPQVGDFMERRWSGSFSFENWMGYGDDSFGYGLFGSALWLYQNLGH